MIARFVLLILILCSVLLSLFITLALVMGQMEHGRELAFVRDESDNFNFNVYLLDIDHRITMRLTSQPMWYDDFEWSPDGSSIAVEMVTRDTQDLIYLVDIVGNVSLMTPGQQPTWSPDGHWLAYITRGAGCSLLLLNVATQENASVCGASSRITMPHWSPDGRWLAYLVGMDTQIIFMIDLPDQRHPRSFGEGAEIAWTMDGSALVYTAYRDHDYDVYQVNLSTGIEQPLTDTLEDERYPVWSPDGTRLAFVAAHDYADFLRILYPNGVISNIDLTALIGWRVIVGEPPVWSPDGTQIVLSLITPAVPNSYSLYMITFGNGIVSARRLTSGTRSESHPAWRP